MDEQNEEIKKMNKYIRELKAIFPDLSLELIERKHWIGRKWEDPYHALTLLVHMQGGGFEFEELQKIVEFSEKNNLRPTMNYNNDGIEFVLYYKTFKMENEKKKE